MSNVTVTESIVIQAPPERVFDFTQDYGRRSEWDPSVLSATVLQKGPPLIVQVRGPAGLTATLRYKAQQRPKLTSLEMTDIRQGFGITGGGGSWRYEPAAGGTLWTQTNTLVFGGRWLYLLLGWISRWNLRYATRKAMQRAKALIEAEG